MECINPDCTKAELLKKLFAGVEKLEELPKFCPFCQQPLRRITDREKAQEETRISIQNDETVVHKEEKRLEAATKPPLQHPSPAVESQDVGERVVKDEKPAVKDDIWSQHDVNDNVHSVHHDLTIGSDGTKNRPLPEVVKQNTNSSEDGSCSSTSGQGLALAPAISRHPESSLNAMNSTQGSGVDTERKKDDYMTYDSDNHNKDAGIQYVTTTTESAVTKRKHEPDTSNVTQHASSDDTSYQSTTSKGSWEITDTSVQWDPLLNSQTHVDSSSSPDKTKLSELDCEDQKMNENSNNDKTHTSGQSKHLEEKEHTSHYNTRYQASLNTSQRPARENNNQDSKETMNQNHPGSNQGPNGVNKDPAKGNVSILGNACVFGDITKSIQNSSSASQDSDIVSTGENLKGKSAQGTEQRSVNKGEGINEVISKSKEKTMDLDPEKKAEGSAERESNSTSSGQVTEDDNKYGSDSSTDQESETEEESKLEGKKSGPKPYGKEEIKEAKKKRKNKKKSGGKKPPKKEEDIDARGRIKMPPKCDEDNVTHSKLQQHQPVGHENSREKLKDIQPTVNAPPSTDPNTEDCITVIFHGLLSPDFRFDPEKQKISIRAGLDELGCWDWNCAKDFTVIGQTKDKFVSFVGEMQVPVRFLRRVLPYKYIVYSNDSKKQKIYWEFSEFRNEYPDTIVDRDLFLLEEFRKKNGIYHQYDGVIYPQPEQTNIVGQVVSWIKSAWHDRKQKFLKYRLHAAETFLPKWRGFVVDENYEQMSAKEAIEKTRAISRCLEHVSICLGFHEIKKRIDGLDFKKILSDFLKSKLEHNAKLSKKDLESSPVRVERLVSTLAIVHLIAQHKLKLTYLQLKDILHCLVIQTSGDKCDFDEIRKDFPEEMWSDLEKSVLHVMKAANDEHYFKFCPDVILAVPLLHFLRKDLKPFEEPEVTHPKTAREWCRAEGLPQFKLYKSIVDSLLPEALPMFTLDPLLRRLFLHCTPFEDLPKLSGNIAFTVHEISTALFYKVRSGNFSLSKFATVDETLSTLLKRQSSKQRQARLDQSKALLFAEVAFSLLQELDKKVKSNDKLFFTGIQFAIETLCSVYGPEGESKTMQNEQQSMNDDTRHKCEGIFFKIVDMVEAVVEKEFKYSVYMSSYAFIGQQVKELEVWTTLLNLNVSRKNLENNWIRSLCSAFEKRLKQVKDEDVVELFCKVENDENFHQSLVQCITQHAFSIVERIAEKGGTSDRSFTALREKILRSGGSSKAGELLSRMITRAWSKSMAKKTVTEHEVLRSALTWRPWARFFSFHGSQEKQKILSQDASNLLHRVIGCLIATQDALANGSIDVRTLMLLNQYEDNFIRLCSALFKVQTTSEGNSKPHPVKEIKRNLEKRNEEYDLFHVMKAHVQQFIDICKSSRDVDFDINGLQVKATCDTSDVRMIDLCKRVPSSDDLTAERVEVVFFDCLPSMFHFILPHISAVYKSKTFQSIWKSKCKALYSEKKGNEMLSGELTLLDVQDKVWLSSIEKWTCLAQSVFDGSINLKDVDRNFKKIASEENLKEELDVMFRQTVEEISSRMDQVAGERVGQITRYRSLQNYVAAAETVWNFKGALGLAGDFGVIEDLRNQVTEEFKDKDLKSINERFTKAGEYLVHISSENSQCLDAVIKCEPLVKWLRETIKDTSALSTLVDLAMISAGENDLEVDRISNFHTSCLSFAPLIFDLDKDFGFEELMRACGPVWEAVKQDKKLSVKLAETCRHLEWLKAVQSSHGSVEMSSIMQAKAINSSGVFRVGQISQDSNGGLSVSSGKKDLDNVLTLSVPIDARTRDPRRRYEEEEEEEEKVELKTYSLNDLKDLQSKLMLIAGKTAQLQNKDCIESTEEINRFVEVLEGVMRLGQVYIDLCEAGDVRYLEWNEEVHCSRDRLSLHRSVAKELAETSCTMEERLQKWRSHVHDKRHEYKQLNHYTTKQILVMRRALGKLREGACAGDMPLQVYTLLESVLPDITSQDLNQVLVETLGFEMDVPRTNMSEYLLPPPTPQQGSFRSANLRERFQAFLLSVEKMDLDEEVAIAALKANDVTRTHDINEDNLVKWCMEHGEDEDLVSEWYDKANEDKDFEDFFPDRWQDEEQDEEQEQEIEVEDVSVEVLPQDEFEQHSYLSLDELGSVLARLSSKCVKPDARKFPDYLRREQPNLILVPKRDVLPTVLTLYMQYGGNSLPSANEVLVCTHETTAEEIELFWWRAFQDSNHQMFCLVHADVLDYNVSQTAVNMLGILMRKFEITEEGYRIIILCSTENEDRSHIIAALDEYRLNAAPSCASADVLSDYLTKQFTCSTSSTGYFNNKRVSWIPAANLDSDSISVRRVCSNRAGTGKSLMITRLFERIPNLQNNLKVTELIENLSLTVTVPLHGTIANTSPLLDGLWKHPVRGDLPVSRIVHLDVSPSVTEGLETLLFNLLVLGVLYDNSGRLWRRKSTDLYMIEMTSPILKASPSTDKWSGDSFISLLPTTSCTPPRTTLQNLKTNQTTKSPLFEDQEYRSVPVQRVFQYLKACDDARQILDRFKFVPGRSVGTQAECLALIIKHCGIRDPSWSELKHFVDFLNSQLHDCEENIFCNPDHVDDQWMQGTLRGFTSFVIRFMVTMSRDFATPSLDDDPIVCSAGLSAEEDDDEDIRPLQLRRRWESSPHPYIFFNEDHITMTFLGFHINANGDLIDPDTKVVIQSALMTKQLRTGLEHQKVDFKTNYSGWTKKERIQKLCCVMGVKDQVDPDTSYELTIDNMKKILAIHMRFRCGIPVVIMGETGCGKTRLIRYMCALQAGPKGQRNMLLMKVHGGTSYKDIEKKVEQAEKMAAENEKKGIDTVLFFDEANTTNALGMIKEVMVDRRINGRPVGVGLRGLHFIAACNPYRRHTDKMIKKLESAGLGYSVKSEETKDKLGRIPLRHLVYRVHALPASMRPLVWDFGQLKPEIEELYIRQIVSRYVVIERSIPGNDSLVKAISNVLAASQKYMRQQQDECSFVSLRDVERTMTVMTWFYRHRVQLRPQAINDEDEDSDEDEDEEESIDLITWSLIMSLGVCYHAKLQDRKAFRKAVTSACAPPLVVNGGQKRMHREIVRCQEVMINHLSLGPNIARNTALSENVFMMVVCIELRIPLFVIGKPGSSKSLAKTVVADNMQGDASKSQLFKTFKRAHMVSYQCSPLSTPDGIVATFRQCRRLQENNPGDRYASVVVLDEVGLAEDSPLLPLKALHPLLEDGVTSSDDIIETDEKPTRVAFIGISNWALDPAKMNRGLMLMRGEPSKGELIDSARGICAESKDIRQHLSTLLEQLAAGYADLYARQKNFESLRTSKRDEFFGLRDFYSLVKMVYSIAAEKNGRPTWSELEHAIRRNFGGLDEIDAVEIFREHVNDARIQKSEPVDTLDLLRASLDHRNAVGESRYLLVLTENYSALRIVEQELIKNKDNYVVIFGSSFPKDQEYTQVCRNINQIKVCMETGRTVVLLNLESLYESLYDALNQYYVYCADQKYVDLGLGSHRVKCRVDDSFRLIVIAEKEVVYKKFPIPLINRLEKHYLVTSKSLRPAQLDLANDLKKWAEDFAQVRRPRHEIQKDFAIGDAFVGYQSDTIPAIVLQACAESSSYTDEASSEDWLPEVKEKCQNLLLQCATPDAMARLSRTRLSLQAKVLWDTYFRQQEHSSLSACLKQLLDQTERCQKGLLVQVSTHSRLLSENDLEDVCHATHFKRRDVERLTLQQFQTEQQFLKQVREFFISLSNDEGILLVQCDSGDVNFNLIACTRHLLMDQRVKRAEMLKEKLKIEDVPPLHIVIIIQLPRVKGGCVNFVGFQGGQWDSFHVDDLRPPTNQIPPIQMLIDRPISELLKPVQSVSREISVEDEENKGDIQDEEEMLTEEGEEEAQTELKAPEMMEIDEEEDIVKLLEQERMNSNVGRFDPMVLLRRSVQAAAGRLEDDAVLAKRTTERIDLILSLLPEDSSKMPDGPSFAKSLHWKIYNLLLEKNEKQSGDLARHWVRHEALSGTSVHERGTFRRALQHKVLTEVEPLLAKVFAYADRDCNLDLLRDQQPWILRLWIFIFNNKRISEICYELSASSTIREHVQVSGKGKHVFRCCFPFSWLIKELIDELWRGLPQGSSRSSESEEDKLRRIMENSELRSILSVIREEGKGDEAGRRYLHDFVHMVYKPNKETQEEEVQLVSRAIIAAAEKRSSEDVHLDFAAIHVAFNLMQSRLNNFNLLVQAEPDLTSLLLEHPNPHLTIDVAGLRACLEKLQPNLDDLETSEKRSEWCGRVLDVRKTIEAMTSKEVFAKRRGAIDDYDEGEKKALQQCWAMWQRLSVVRLFIDHVCSFSRQTNAEDVKNIFKLWKILGDDTNFLKATCIRGLEGFLLQCSQEHRKRNKWYSSFEVTCDICKGQAKKPSVTPCGHCCCLECSSRWFSEQLTCPRCRQPVPADYTPAESEEVREALNNITSFRNQCNSFFMEVVSLFCFGYSPCGTLEEDAYKLLMDYVTGEKARGGTRRFSPFPDQGIDINPVVRSFLLQQLLKSSDQKVKDYMGVFIQRAQDIQEMDAVSSVEVFVMCIQCMEDALNSRFARFGSQQELDQKLRLLETDFKAAAALLGEAREDEALDIKWLEGIANTRFVLSKAADFMYQSRNDARSQNWSNPDVNRALDRLIGEVKNICVKTQMNTPRLFLLKQLSRKFGFESINALAEEFEWMLPAEAKEASELTQDRFLVYGLEYQSLRETISRAVISGDMDTIQEALQNMTSPGHVANVALLLGIYQEVTANKQGFISETIQQRLQDFVQNSENISDQSRILARDLVTKTEGNIPDMVLGVAGDTPWDRSLVEIIVHLAAVMFSRDRDDLAGPLLSLALRPAAIANTFLPTMPEDTLQDVRSAVVGTLYECPNGHPYLVTECGRPTEQSKCRVPGCGADIGGVDHQLTRANKAARTSDLSKKGHCLGSPTERGTDLTPEREMSALATYLLRLLVHGSMLIGSCYHKQDIGQLISPAIRQDSVLGFLWKHAMCDMNLLSKVSGRSVDDTALIVHMVLRSLSEHAPARQGLRDALKTKQERKQWENNFSTSLVVPLMTNLESSIQKTMELIVNDKRFGTNPLLRQLYELESCVDDSQSKINSNCLALWRYRTPVTLDHVTRAFNESADAQDEDCVVLREFLKNEHKLRAVRFLPDVVKLQQLLMDRYHRTLNKTEMDKLKWKDFEKRLPKGTTKAEYKALRKSFRLAWGIMVAILKEQGAKGTIRKVLQHSVDDDSPISMFIPANSGLGTCSMFLVQFLVRAHNDFMELYKRYSGNTPNQQLAPVKEVTCSQLVAYDADRDLLPLMQAHCHYSLEVGHGTLVEYDWTAIQRQLVDRLVRGRVLVDFKEGEYIKTAQVSAESVLTTLKIKIPQVELSVAIEAQIAGQYRSLEDVCEALSSLNIAITFLASGGGKRSMLISNYIHQVLKLPEDAGMRNIKAQEVCQIQHAVSLWRLLSFERAKILTKRKQDPFEHLSPEFKVGLPEAVEVSVNSGLRKMSDKCLDSFGSVLLEVIVLRLNDSLDINKDCSLKSYMTWYLDDKDVDPIPEVEDIPDEVLLEHIVRFWQIVYAMSDKYHDRRMEATG